MPNCYCLNPDCLRPENPPAASTCAFCGQPLLLRNRYRAFKRLGQGGFGATFLARDEDMPSKPWRVIKQLRPAENSPQLARLAEELFNREAEVLERLGEHSQIPKLYAHFQEGGKFYLVQEFIEGITLAQEMRRNGPFSEEQARQVMQEVLLILSYVHSHNTVHRDIKPANLIRRKEDGRLVLIDFGAVKQLGPGHTLSEEGTAIRSLGFSPPEQMAGQAVGPASDLYALAATCLNLMTLESPAKFYDHNTGQWDWSDRLQLSPEFDAILRRMLHPVISQRFATATEALRALQGIPVQEGPPSSPVILPPSPLTAGSSPLLISDHWTRRRSTSPPPCPNRWVLAYAAPSARRGRHAAPGIGSHRLGEHHRFYPTGPSQPHHRRRADQASHPAAHPVFGGGGSAGQVFCQPELSRLRLALRRPAGGRFFGGQPAGSRSARDPLQHTATPLAALFEPAPRLGQNLGRDPSRPGRALGIGGPGVFACPSHHAQRGLRLGSSRDCGGGGQLRALVCRQQGLAAASV